MAALISNVFPYLPLAYTLGEAFVSSTGPHLLCVWLCSEINGLETFPHFLVLKKKEEQESGEVHSLTEAEIGQEPAFAIF